MPSQPETNPIPDIDLSKLRIWLSGAVPESDTVPPETKQSFEVWGGSSLEHGILGFVQEFSSLVFKFGGQIIHGCHPTLTPILIEQAKRFGSGGETKKLNLAVSDFFEKQSSGDWARWRKSANVEVVPRTGDGDENRDPSLAVLREKMVEQCNAFVVIGGLWWKDRPGRAGIPKEFELAYFYLTKLESLDGLGIKDVEMQNVSSFMF